MNDQVPNPNLNQNSSLSSNSNSNHELSFQTPGYEHLELSTQILIAEALKRGVNVEVLDEKDQFIKLQKQDHIEYVQAATQTSRDTYITSIILGNKHVTKIILNQVQVRVPEGKYYHQPEEAFKDYDIFSQKKIVIKPKTTNFGIGIFVLEASSTEADYRKAVATAFEHDSSILIEEFLEGIECRFLVIDGKTVAVLHRVPANIKGDGIHTIRELVEIKNSDPRRGKGYKTPLELIQLGEMELSILDQQGFTSKSVPPQDTTVFLRKNSNISTGGDSLDYTDVVHDSYKRIAEKAANAVEAKICGVDMMIQNSNVPLSENNYGIIELNYNPVLYFHDYPFRGKNRHTAKYVIDLLGF